MIDLENHTSSSLLETITTMDKHGLLHPDIVKFYMTNVDRLQSAIDSVDQIHVINYKYLGAETLKTLMLMKTSATEAYPVERPEYLYMRVAVQQWYPDVEKVIHCYRSLSSRVYIHATPTLTNSGSKKPQLNSCFLTDIDDSLQNILEVNKEIGMISKYNGGNGIYAGRLRKSEIGNADMSPGVIPALQMYDETIAYCKQSRVRKGAVTMFLPPHHLDIEDFLNQAPQYRMSRGVDDKSTLSKLPHSHMCLWVSNLFMERVMLNQDWTLFCPARTPGLEDCFGTEFNRLFVKYERDSTLKAHWKKTVPARQLMNHITDMQCAGHKPFMMYKDQCDMLSNQQNMGPTRSNLCTEIVQYASKDETSVCNLASINLSSMYDSSTNDVNWKLLTQVSRELVKNLLQVTERNFYPSAKAKISSRLHRQMGIGVSGFADLLWRMDIPLETYDGQLNPKAQEVNEKIFACINFNSTIQNVIEAQKIGCYPSFRGGVIPRLPEVSVDVQEDEVTGEIQSVVVTKELPPKVVSECPLSQGKLHVHLWSEAAQKLLDDLHQRYGTPLPKGLQKYEERLKTRASFKPIDPASWGKRQLKSGIH